MSATLSEKSQVGSILVAPGQHERLAGGELRLELDTKSGGQLDDDDDDWVHGFL
jgi:hypothetical protein